jgi:hypothetical protein
MSKTARDRVVAEMKAWLIERKQAIALLKTIDPDILAAAVDCFGSSRGAGQFLTSPAPSLGYKFPVEVGRTPEGKKRVLHIIRAIDYGVYL